MLNSSFVRWAGRLVFGIFFVFLLLSAVAFVFKAPAPPGIEDAQWGIQTYSNDEFRVPSRIYYTNKIEVVNGVPIAKNSWWSYDGRNYHRHNGDKTFSPTVYGNIDIIRRQQ
jgi:hypothetical protein